MSWTLLPFCLIAAWSTLKIIGGERRRLIDERQAAAHAAANPEKTPAAH